MTKGGGRTYQRGKRWWCAYYFQGQEIRESAGDTQKQAQAYLTSRLQSIQVGKFRGVQADRVTVAILVDEHLAELQNREVKSRRDIKSHLKPVLERLGATRALDLTPSHIHAYIAERRAAGKANGTISQELSHLRAALNAAFKHERLPKQIYVPMAGTGKPRRGFLEVEAFDAILANLDGVHRDMTEFAYLTGWRYEEVTSLTWDCVDLASREIRLPDSKNDEGRTLPIIPLFAHVLERRWQERAIGCSRVFHLRGMSIGVSWREAFESAAEAAGYPAGLANDGLIPHDMRRSAVRNMVRAGVPETVAMTISGHRSRNIFSRYNITSTDDQAKAFERLSTYLDTRRGQAKAKIVRLGGEHAN
jgi:integrase